jgi:hypothetical protein
MGLIIKNGSMYFEIFNSAAVGNWMGCSISSGILRIAIGIKS